jgi:hypothetical protein
MDNSDNGFKDAGRVTRGSFRETGAPGRRVLVLAAWRSGDRALRAMVTRLKELVPCNFEILNLESPTAVRFRESSLALFRRIRRCDAAVFAFTARDGAASPALQLPSGRLPLLRFLRKRIPAAYLVDGPASPELDKAIIVHARAWHLLPLCTPTDAKEGGDGLESLAASLIGTLE